VQIDQDGNNIGSTFNILTQANGLILSIYQNNTASSHNPQLGEDEIYDPVINGLSRVSAAVSHIRENADTRVQTAQTIEHQSFSSGGGTDVLAVSLTFRPYHDNIFYPNPGVLDPSRYLNGDESQANVWTETNGNIRIAKSAITSTQYAASLWYSITLGSFPSGIADARLEFAYPIVLSGTAFDIIIEIEDALNAVLPSGGDLPSTRTYFGTTVIENQDEVLTGESTATVDLSPIFQAFLLENAAASIEAIHFRLRPQTFNVPAGSYAIVGERTSFNIEPFFSLLTGAAPVPPDAPGITATGIYIVNKTVRIKWILPPNPSPPTAESLDTYIVAPSTHSGGLGLYTNEATLVSYTPPTLTTQGLVQYNFTPDEVGKWDVSLTIGSEAVHAVESHKIFYVVDIIADGVSPFVTHRAIRGVGP